jgi:hypothetical protein
MSAGQGRGAAAICLQAAPEGVERLRLAAQAHPGVGEGGERGHVVRIEGEGALERVGGLREAARVLVQPPQQRPGRSIGRRERGQAPQRLLGLCLGAGQHRRLAKDPEHAEIVRARLIGEAQVPERVRVVPEVEGGLSRQVASLGILPLGRQDPQQQLAGLGVTAGRNQSAGAVQLRVLARSRRARPEQDRRGEDDCTLPRFAHQRVLCRGAGPSRDPPGSRLLRASLRLVRHALARQRYLQEG